MSDTDTKTVRVAVPSEHPGGLDAPSSGHFGHCTHFTIADMRDGEAVEVLVVENLPHQEGGCMQPVLMLAQHKIDAIVVNGIGGRPLMGFNQVGIPVYGGIGSDVGSTLAAFAAGQLSPLDPGQACRH